MPAQPPPSWTPDDGPDLGPEHLTQPFPDRAAQRAPGHRPVRLSGGAVLATVAALTLLVSVVGGAVLVSRSGAGDEAARLAAAAGRTSSEPPAELADGPSSPAATDDPAQPSTDPAAPGTTTTSSAPATRSKAPARKGTRTTTPARPRPATTTTRTTTRTTHRTTKTTRPTTRTSTRTTTSAAAPGGSLAQQVLALTNDERAKAGCKALSWDATLAKVAQAHSEDMAANGYFAHESQDGRSPFDRMKAAGYAFRTAAENIAAGQPTPTSVMKSWMNSSGHRANILNCSLTELGVGVAKGGPYGIYWTQDFGTPA